MLDVGADVPRRNGELAFDAPWESRVFGLALAYLERSGQPWEPFRQRLMVAIAEAPDETPYYESFTAALVRLLTDDGVLTPREVNALR